MMIIDSKIYIEQRTVRETFAEVKIGLEKFRDALKPFANQIIGTPHDGNSDGTRLRDAASLYQHLDKLIPWLEGIDAKRSLPEAFIPAACTLSSNVMLDAYCAEVNLDIILRLVGESLKVPPEFSMEIGDIGRALKTILWSAILPE